MKENESGFSPALVCDFCSSSEIVTAYQCGDFVIDKDSLLPFGSKGAWAACAICAALIDAERWKHLLARSVKTFGLKYGLCHPEIERELSDLHANFRRHLRRAA